jgi:high-affinity K+ transport system ATPase subunit B
VRQNWRLEEGRISGSVEAAGDVDTLLLDKTGTITLGNRQAAEFIPLPGVSAKELADAAQLASLSDETPEGRSIVVLAKEKFGIRGRPMIELNAKFIPFSAHTRLGGIDTELTAIRKGAVDAILANVRSTANGPLSDPETISSALPLVSEATVRALQVSADMVSKLGGTPLAVAKDGGLLEQSIQQPKDVRTYLKELKPAMLHLIRVDPHHPGSLDPEDILGEFESFIYWPAPSSGKSRLAE